MRIAVIDDGVGIKESEKEKIFERFYQIESSGARYSSGTGIGLHLSRSLVELHKGVLFLETRKQTPGSEFVILLPMGNEHLALEDMITEKTSIPAPINKVYRPVISDHYEESKETKRTKSDIKIMVVEDETDVRQYLRDELSEIYDVITCENGKKAHEILLEEKPDLIISDIMMPEMDGITFCKKVKKNMLTSHIPVILLTALSKEEDRSEGIETGADMYMVKPFNSDFLKKVIHNILENRKKTVQQFKQNPNHEIENIELKSHDEVLMQEVMTIIKDNISNEELNVEMLADGIGISRVHMHRKLKEITNQSARDFIKGIRMKQAAYLLTTKKINVSEVAYAIGYSNLSNFSRSFRDFYGVSPKEYIQKQYDKLDENKQ
nr:response regulator [uncultured Carboxylicivirga sp.]